MKALLSVPFGLCAALLVLLGSGTAYGQYDSLGGPYVTDANTMLLMHFDGNLNNEGSSANGVGHGRPGALGYLSNSGLGLGQCLRLVNDATSDSAYVTVADSSTLDLVGSWTIEGWINIFTFGSGSGDHRWVPRLVIKTGDAVFWRPNYFVEMWGSWRGFSCGYNVAGADRWPQANSPTNSMTPGSWYHLTFIRDTTRNIIITMVHNAQRQLTAFATTAYDPILDNPPITTSQPIHIGFAGGGNDSWLDGFVDEIRISNKVRNFRVPPIITQVTQVPNQPSSVTEYPVSARIQAFSVGGLITTARIRYNDGGGWNEAVMTQGANDIFTGSIPQRPVGTIIDYYVYAVDNGGLRSTVPPTAEIDSTYFTFGIYTPNTQTIHLAFEQTSGTPFDSSLYHNVGTFPNNPASYSTDAKVGARSLHFDRDSTHVQFNSPFLAAEQFAVDFWLKSDSLIHANRILNKEGGNLDGTPADDWYHNNYELGIRNVSGAFRPSARYWLDSADAQFELRLDSVALQTQSWFRFMFERNSTTAAFEVRNANNEPLQRLTAAADKPRRGAGLLRIGKASSDGQPWDYIPHFRGKIDDLKIYNYAALGIVSGVGENGSNVPTQFALEQNYPNPFNPTTEIRFALAKATKVSLVVYDVLGRKVKTLINDDLHAGEYRVEWNGTNESGRSVASGAYFYQLESEKFISVRKMMFLK
ncbi:MAG: T9SS type A sorting domain-containing protein [Ignavibacteriae bacterium]|nr:T9SS type A sorting domain-containing protein [Ignavibacteriota bacterium]